MTYSTADRLEDRIRHAVVFAEAAERVTTEALELLDVVLNEKKPVSDAEREDKLEEARYDLERALVLLREVREGDDV
jgi:hypothetical protein